NSTIGDQFLDRRSFCAVGRDGGTGALRKVQLASKKLLVSALNRDNLYPTTNIACGARHPARTGTEHRLPAVTLRGGVIDIVTRRLQTTVRGIQPRKAKTG